MLEFPHRCARFQWNKNSIFFLRNLKCKKYVKFPHFINFPNATLWLHLSTCLNLYLDLENYYKVNIADEALLANLTALKRPLFVFQKSLTVIGRKNTWQILMFFKMATVLKADQINEGYLNWLIKTSWVLKISYRQLSFLMLRPKLYRLSTIILSCLKHLLILLA